jgi:hypothetical protein
MVSILTIPYLVQFFDCNWHEKRGLNARRLLIAYMNNMLFLKQAAFNCTQNISVFTGKAPALPGFFYSGDIK